MCKNIPVSPKTVRKKKEGGKKERKSLRKSNIDGVKNY
jgi:hypothetical protein